MDSNEDPAKNYSLRGRIMFSAIVVLFTIVFLLFCVHVYSRWFLLRRSRRNNYLWNQRNQLLFAENVQTVPTAVCGLEESVLKNLPIIVFSEKTKSIECAVCLCEFEENERLRLLPSCNHRFHIDCIDMWFHSHSNCPLCRAPVKIPVQLEHQKEADQCDSCRQFTEIEPSASSTSSTSSSSASSSREQLGFLTIEVPRMAGSFRVIEEETVSPYPNSFRSMGRLFSLKTILGKDRRGSATETDLETGEDESRHGTISR